MKKIGFIILAVVVALGAIGAGYAAWSQTLTIAGQVNTGSYDVIFDNVVASETDAYNLTTSDTAISNEQDHSFTVTVTNGYPGYVGVATFDVKNNGTVPAVIKSVTVTGADAAVYTAVVNGIAANDTIAVSGTISDCTVTITIIDDATESAANQEFTVTIETEQGV